MLVPATRSIGMRCSSHHLMNPICAMPLALPPPSARPTVGRRPCPWAIIPVSNNRHSVRVTRLTERCPRRLRQRPFCSRATFLVCLCPHVPIAGPPPGIQRTRHRLASGNEGAAWQSVVPVPRRTETGAAPRARRDNGEYCTYLRAEQRRQRGCIARRMQRHWHHGLSGPAPVRGPAPRVRAERPRPLVTAGRGCSRGVGRGALVGPHVPSGAFRPLS